MFQSFTLLSLFVLVSTAFASPVQRASNNRILRLASKINPIQTGKTLPEIDRARVATIVSNASAKKNGKRADNPVVATDIAVVYTASVGVGNPPTQCGFYPFRPLLVPPLGPYVFCLIRHIDSRYW